MIFYNKNDRDYFSYDTNSNRYYYLNKKSLGKTPWSWEKHVKSGTIFSLAPNLMGAWQDE